MGSLSGVTTLLVILIFSSVGWSALLWGYLVWDYFNRRRARRELDQVFADMDKFISDQAARLPHRPTSLED